MQLYYMIKKSSIPWFHFNNPKLHFYIAQALSRPPLYLWLWVSCQVLSTISRHWTLGTKTWLGLPVQLKILFWLAEINIVVLKLCCSDKFFWLKLWISEILLSHLWTVFVCLFLIQSCMSVSSSSTCHVVKGSGIL